MTAAIKHYMDNNEDRYFIKKVDLQDVCWNNANCPLLSCFCSNQIVFLQTIWLKRQTVMFQQKRRSGRWKGLFHVNMIYHISCVISWSGSKQLATEIWWKCVQETIKHAQTETKCWQAFTSLKMCRTFTVHLFTVVNVPATDDDDMSNTILILTSSPNLSRAVLESRLFSN